MIQMLSAIGRVVVVVAAAITVAATTLAGYFFARASELASYGTFTISEGGKITPLELAYALIGFAVGLIVAGAVFGAIATLYEIRDSLILLANARSDDPAASLRERREPHVG